MELDVYSTKAGRIPLMVRRDEAQCFVPYEQAQALQERIAQLEADLATVKADRDAFGQNAIDLQNQLKDK